MTSLRALAESDLSTTLEGDFGMSVSLISPAGERQGDIQAQVIYEQLRETETGTETVVREPAVTVRISSLDVVPVTGEKWAVTIPVSPVPGAATETLVTTDRPFEGGESIGFLTMYLTKAKQA